MKGVRTSTIQPYKIIVRCEQRDGPPRPSAHHVTGRLKKKKKKKITSTETNITSTDTNITSSDINITSTDTNITSTDTNMTSTNTNKTLLVSI